MKRLLGILFLSATLPAVAQEALTVPYVQNFNDRNDFNTMTVIDANHDNKTWQWRGSSGRGYVQCSANIFDNIPADDWILTPAIHLDGGKSYLLGYLSRQMMQIGQEKLGVAIGQGDDPTQFTTVVADRLITNTDYEHFEHSIQVVADGDYRIAFHAGSLPNQYAIYLDSITLNLEALPEAPDSVTALTVTPGSKGALNASISFTAPTKTGEGQTLTALEKIDILRNDTVITSLNNVAPGNAYSYTDETPQRGIQKYTVKAYNTSGQGVRATRTVFVGKDEPLPPKEAYLTDNLDGSVKVTWTAAPATGKNGGYVDMDELSYRVFEPKTSELQEIQTGVLNTSLDIPDVTNTSTLSVVSFAVGSETPEGKSNLTQTNGLVTGPTSAIPFHDSFAGGNTETGKWWTEPLNGETFSFTSDYSSDESAGAAMWKPYDINGDRASFNTAKLSLGNAANPVLTFDYMAYPGKSTRMSVLASVNGQRPDTLAMVDFATLEGEAGWRTEVVGLSRAKGSNYVVMKLAFNTTDVDDTLLIDNVNIIDATDVDASISNDRNSLLTRGETSRLNAVVSNNGTSDIPSATVSFYINDKEIGNETVTDLGVGRKQNVVVDYAVPVTLDADSLTFKAVVATTGDGNEGNNTSSVRLPLADSKMQAVDGVAINGTTISWNVPEIADSIVTESFEDYPAFSVDGFGHWLAADFDGQKTIGFGDASFPHENETFGYIVFNPRKANISTTVHTEMAPHSGSQYLATFSSAKANDAWLFSPELNGEAQTVSLWAKNVDWEYPESFEVRYTTSNTYAGTDTTTYTGSALTVADAGENWTRYEASVPQGTTFFAIKSSSVNEFALFFDDISYHPAVPQLVKYNIYCDGQYIGESTTNSFEIPQGTIGRDYHVSAVYVLGPVSGITSESKLSSSVATEISNVYNSSVSGNGNAPRFNIMGQRIGKDYKGIVIQNGKKHIEK